MTEIFEVLMVVCFGVSWPISIIKSYKSRTAKGKSLLFICLIWVGYVFGVVNKLIQSSITYVLIFYIINLVTVSIDLALYFRNRKLDRAAEVTSK